MSSFDPNGIGLNNGNVFGFSVTEEEAELVIIPVPWDGTASYAKGTSNGPEAILQASRQLDFYHHELESAWESKIFMTEISQEWKKISDDINELTIPYIDYLESGGNTETSTSSKEVIEQVNETQNVLKSNLKERVSKILSSGKVVAMLGGEHSIPLALIEELSLKYCFGILQIDAHADLRIAYEGFEQSHASIMQNAIKNESISKLVQVGVRDLCPQEANEIAVNDKIECFYDKTLKQDLFQGKNWKNIASDIVRELPQKVYISFDIDGLEPSLCPNTGTPVPGGLTYDQATYLISQVVKSGREIIGFDLCEVAAGENEWDANVGARVLWELCVATLKSQLNNK